MSDFTDIITNVSNALAGNKESKEGLYGLLFGNKQIPVQVSLDQETEIVLLAAIGLLAAGAVMTGFVVKR